ncbi:MAG: hypothetical protein GYA17_03810 [Chloroflexi bacterium]|nr:hypothetical protein [Chloroflexota bacterium]
MEMTYTEYTWRMVSSQDGRFLCRVIVAHEGYPTLNDARPFCLDILYPATETPAPTPTYEFTPTPGGAYQTPTATPEPLVIENEFMEIYLEASWELESTRPVKVVQRIPIPPMVVELNTPDKPVKVPAIVIKASEPVSDYTIMAIDGTVNGTPFHCPVSVCEIRLDHDAEVVYWATSSLGDESQHYRATVRVAENYGGYYLTKTAYSPVSLFVDTCADIWGSTATGASPSWVNLPASPDDLRTDKTLHYLAQQLIRHGVVDASSCPGGGLNANGSPNGCGIDQAQQAMLDWQNRFDLTIWSTAQELGIPAKYLKSLIEQESQFWPASAANMFDEYGLGQVNEMGADSALRWDTNLNALVCTGLFYNCATQYDNLVVRDKMMLQGGLVQWVNADCPDCAYGIDLVRAEQSISILARMLRGSCRQTGYVLGQSASKASREDMWRFTTLTYHAGGQCLTDAVDQARQNGQAINWTTISQNLDSCPGSQLYVDSLWEKIRSYDSQAPLAAPTAQPEMIIEAQVPTPIPTRRTDSIDGMVHVTVYLDINNNQRQDPGEALDQVEVVVRYSGGDAAYQKTEGGRAEFPFVDQMAGSILQVQLPYYYREAFTRIPASGEVNVEFRLPQPALPSTLP